MHTSTTARRANKPKSGTPTVRARWQQCDRLAVRMRRSYDPHYGSREQLKDCHQAGMALMRERDALKAEIVELKALIKYLSEGE